MRPRHLDGIVGQPHIAGEQGLLRRLPANGALDRGEDPAFLSRRMLILAAEDIGLADPAALQVALAAAEGFERVGLPEGSLLLGEAAIYLALAPK